jgi:hypothetical protein
MFGHSGSLYHGRIQRTTHPCYTNVELFSHVAMAIIATHPCCTNVGASLQTFDNCYWKKKNLVSVDVFNSNAIDPQNP